MRIVLPPWGDTRGAHPNLPKGEGPPCGLFSPQGGHEGAHPNLPKGEGLPCGMFAY